MTGEDQPSPGMGVFHTMFSVFDHWVGKLVAVEIP
jgi:hypothetical protein